MTRPASLKELKRKLNHSRKPQVQVNFRLPEDLCHQLIKSAMSNGITLTQEVRQRLISSFKEGR